MSGHFTGGQKRLDHFLRGYEEKLIAAFLPLVPPWMGTVQLTLLTFLWAALVIFFGRLAAGNVQWLWGFSACIFVQHITDMLDGEVGRRRNTGLIKWGFYMDHLLDYVFSCAVIAGYAFLLPSSHFYLVLLWMVAGAGFLVHAFLDFGVTGEFKISFNRFGVAEIRHALILLNVILVFFGKEILAGILPFIVAVFWGVLGALVAQSQAGYRAMDRRETQKHQ